MSQPETTNILITGTKTGIGHGLVTLYASRPHTTIIAAIRDAATSSTAQEMISSIPDIHPTSTIIPVQYDASSLTSATSMISALQTSHPQITHLNLVIANAGIVTEEARFHSVDPSDIQANFQTNTMGPILLYQACRPLLVACPPESFSKVAPKFIYISSAVASLTNLPQVPFDVGAYGISRIGGNYFVRKANAEEDRIVLVAVDPGLVQTRQGNAGAEKLGLPGGLAPTTVVDCCEGIAKLVEKVGKADGKGAGLFLKVADGQVAPW